MKTSTLITALILLPLLLSCSKKEEPQAKKQMPHPPPPLEEKTDFKKEAQEKKYEKLQEEIETKTSALATAQQEAEQHDIRLKELQTEVQNLENQSSTSKDRVTLSNGKTAVATASSYNEDIFTLILPSGKEKRARSTSIKKIIFEE